MPPIAIALFLFEEPNGDITKAAKDSKAIVNCVAKTAKGATESPKNSPNTSSHCHICLAPFHANDLITQLSCCKLSTHAECLSAWIDNDRGRPHSETDYASFFPECMKCRRFFQRANYYCSGNQQTQRPNDDLHRLYTFRLSRAGAQDDVRGETMTVNKFLMEEAKRLDAYHVEEPEPEPEEAGPEVEEWIQYLSDEEEF